MQRLAWIEQDNATIKSLAGKVSSGELARQLNRTEAATRYQAWKIGVSLKHRPGGVKHRQQKVQPISDSVEKVVAPSAIERALSIYRQFQDREQAVVEQARKILTKCIYGMVDQGECDEQRLTVLGLTHLKAVERDHAIKSAQAAVPRKRSRV